MSITEGKINIGTSDENLDTTKVIQSDDVSVHREAVVITDPKKLANRSNVFEIPPSRSTGQTYASAVTDQRLEFIQGVMEEVLGELKTINRHLAAMTNEEFDNDSS